MHLVLGLLLIHKVSMAETGVRHPQWNLFGWGDERGAGWCSIQGKLHTLGQPQNRQGRSITCTDASVTYRHIFQSYQAHLPPQTTFAGSEAAHPRYIRRRSIRISGASDRISGGRLPEAESRLGETAARHRLHILLLLRPAQRLLLSRDSHDRPAQTLLGWWSQQACAE